MVRSYDTSCIKFCSVFGELIVISIINAFDKIF